MNNGPSRLHSTSMWAESPSVYCHNVWYGKTRMVVLRNCKKMRICSRMRVMNHNLSGTKRHLHPQSVGKIRGQNSTMWDIFWVLPDQCKSRFPSEGTAVSLRKLFSIETTVAEGDSKPGRRTLSWPPEPVASYASINFWCQLVTNPGTAASLMSVVAMVG